MTGTVEDEAALVAALRDGEEAVFAVLVERYTPSLLRVARGYVPSHETAEEVVHEASKARGIRGRRSVDAEIAAYTTLGSVKDDALDPAYRDRLLNAFRDWRQIPSSAKAYLFRAPSSCV